MTCQEYGNAWLSMPDCRCRYIVAKYVDVKLKTFHSAIRWMQVDFDDNWSIQLLVNPIVSHYPRHVCPYVKKAMIKGTSRAHVDGVVVFGNIISCLIYVNTRINWPWGLDGHICIVCISHGGHLNGGLEGVPLFEHAKISCMSYVTLTFIYLSFYGGWVAAYG